jgi:hypothetical protein
MTRFTACFEVSANWGAGVAFLAYVTFIWTNDSGEL